MNPGTANTLQTGNWGQFELRGKDGVYAHFTKKNATWSEQICGYLEVIALSRNEHGKTWGKVLRWIDRDERSHQRSISESWLFKGGTNLLEILSGEGLHIGLKRRAFVKKYLDAVTTDARWLNVPRTGWYTLSTTGDRVFVMPDRVIGDTSGKGGVVFQSDSFDDDDGMVRC